jgi:hypothetical protein
MADATTQHEGGCLCGAVRYQIDGPLRDVIVCHCSICRRAHGGPAPHTSCSRDQLAVVSDSELRWHEYNDSRRGFCGACGGRLFWDRPTLETISIAAGSLDQPTGLKTMRHIFLDSAADWEDPP